MEDFKSSQRKCCLRWFQIRTGLFRYDLHGQAVLLKHENEDKFFIPICQKSLSLQLEVIFSLQSAFAVVKVHLLYKLYTEVSVKYFQGTQSTIKV